MKRAIIIFFVITHSISAQELDITSALQNIESGSIQKAEAELKDLKSKNPNDPSVIFLDAVTTKNGEEAQKKYSIVYEKYPKSNYADAALYRIFSYYYSLGYYKKAETYLSRLKSEYPNSPYIKSADRNIPDDEEPVAVAQQEQKLPIAETEYNFTIQAGAFLNVDNAMNLSQQIKNDGYFSEITTKEVGGSILNIVNVGKFVNENETKPVLEYLSHKFNLNGRAILISK